MDVKLLASHPHVTGSRATLKAVEKGQAMAVFLAADAEKRVVQPLREACLLRGVEVVEIPSMQHLGRAARLAVPAAAAALIIKE
ncbi:MAG: ribosomal L7Ae/L30e/S12e/Gadd45 family protein [Clostridiales bacterium]|nr:ribosomal L7Ae/L30e/S12e/Gadd45 family protein [Clostridiales bacterium]